MLQRLRFIAQFLRSPLRTGAIAESSGDLAEMMLADSNLASAKCVVELGSGGGAFTEEIVKKMRPQCDFFVIELNPYFAKKTKERHPTVIVYNDTAENIRAYFKKEKQCDLIVSGLPWASFRRSDQEKMVSKIKKSLSDHGEFRTFAYLQGLLLPSGRHFRKLLKENFSSIKKTKIIWKNVPPAFVYRCKK